MDQKKKKIEQLKKEILDRIDQYYKIAFERESKKREKDFIPCSEKSFNIEELKSGVESILDGWWTEGRFSDMFIEEFKKFIPIKHVILVNSGSSANLLALFSLTSHLIEEDKRLKKGDEVITLAAGFPTTINPIILANCIPVFVDIDLETLNININQLEKAITDKTKAVFIAHTLGNPFNVDEVKKICKKYNLWLIEDCCDALGSKYKNQPAGTFGDLATFSFYPAHHITMGEGGAIITNNDLLNKIITSLRGWGRDCWCRTGKDNTCGKRFNQKFGDLPLGYDHKYVYSHLGFNLKLTDMQAAIGYAQIKKINEFIRKRKENFNHLYNFFSKNYSNIFYLPISNSEPSWFGSPLTLKENCKFSRNDLIKYLNDNNIGTRLLFGGNITKQPYFKNLNIKFKAFNLKNTDYIMDNNFWIGIQPTINKEDLEYITKVFDSFFKKKKKKINFSFSFILFNYINLFINPIKFLL